MAIKDANNAELDFEIGGTTYQLISGTSITFNRSAEAHSARHMGQDRLTYWVTYKDWTLQGEALWDVATSGSVISHLEEGSTVKVTYWPEGKTAGISSQGTGILTAFSVTGAMDSAIAVSFSVQGNSDIVDTP